MNADTVNLLSLIAVLVSVVSNGICVVGVLYIRSVVAPLRAELTEHRRRLDLHHHETSNLWERTSRQGERIATLEGLRTED